MATITKSQLRAAVIATGSSYFNRGVMKFFGDTMANYGVRPNILKLPNDEGDIEYVDVWELYRKQPVKDGLHHSVYFQKETFNLILI